ncbi:hypothetical protein B0G75_11584 [Paraburkholderia sp. BL18I3N2]|nr:hypothetical protein B0G75_11584 [Paraburkholderia sp. BL18I3N2]
MSARRGQPPLDDSLDYMITRTKETKIVYAYPSFAGAVGSPLDEIVGPPFLRYLDAQTPCAIDAVSLIYYGHLYIFQGNLNPFSAFAL